MSAFDEAVEAALGAYEEATAARSRPAARPPEENPSAVAIRVGAGRMNEELIRRARQLLISIEDILIDALGEEVWGDKPDEWWPEEHGIRTLRKWWCEQVGHDPMPDNCGILEHEFCAVCFESTPGAWTAIQEGVTS